MSRLDLLPPARAIFLTGFMGTGKTTNGLRLAQRLGLPFVDTDIEVERRAGRSIPEIFAQQGEEVFRDLETQVLREVVAGPRAVVSTGGGIMLREENIQLMRSAGPIICLRASPKTIHERTAHRGDRPLLQTEQPLETIRSLLRNRQAAYARADYQVSTDHGDRDQPLRDILRTLQDDPRTAVLARPYLRVSVRADQQFYRIHIASGCLSQAGALCPPPAAGARCAIITTDVVAELYGTRVADSLREAGWEPKVIAVPDGEQSKCLEMASVLYDRLVEAGVDSAGAVFALGGGMVGDLAGFVAATYRRGIRLAQLPTTLLAQVDSSSGGKVAVDHPRGKNLIGAFYQPSAVLVDTDTLRTLPARELRCGLAEVIKHAFIADAGLFGYLESELDAFMSLQDHAVRYVVARNCQIKAQFVKRDPYDRGVRACLNFGHTVGHALERAAPDWDLRHGEAVSIGMVAEARMAQRLGICEAQLVERLQALLERAGLPTAVPSVGTDRATAALMQDKKMAAGRLRLPVVPRLGEVEVSPDVSPDLLLSCLCAEPQPSRSAEGGADA